MTFRKFNWQIWTGFLLTLIAGVSFQLFFVNYPITRDFPWATLLMLGVAAVFLFIGIRRAFEPGRRLGGKIVASVLTVISVLTIGLFLFGAFVLSKWLPESKGAPQVGQTAPEFSLLDPNGSQVTLAQLLSEPVNGKVPKGVLLVFYRGYW